MKKWTLLLLLFILPLQAGAQGHIRRAMEKARERQDAMARQQSASEQGKQGAGYLRMQVVDGDTLYFDSLKPVWIYGRGRGKSDKAWRDYYKLVYRFARVYPYAVAAGRLQYQIDSAFAVNNYSRLKKERIVTDVQRQLFQHYESALHKMTISQGALLLKLISRETGHSSYSIIKDYKNGVAAGFWQGVARLFDNDLRSEYDPEGADKDTEELVRIWKAGHFPALYWSVFWEDPPQIETPDIRL